MTDVHGWHPVAQDGDDDEDGDEENGDEDIE